MCCTAQEYKQVSLDQYRVYFPHMNTGVECHVLCCTSDLIHQFTIHHLQYTYQQQGLLIDLINLHSYILHCNNSVVQGDTKKRELLKNPTKIEEIQEKKIACSAECDSVALCSACNTHRVTQKNGNFCNA